MVFRNQIGISCGLVAQFNAGNVPLRVGRVFQDDGTTGRVLRKFAQMLQIIYKIFKLQLHREAVQDYQHGREEAQPA